MFAILGDALKMCGRCYRSAFAISGEQDHGIRMGRTAAIAPRRKLDGPGAGAGNLRIPVTGRPDQHQRPCANQPVQPKRVGGAVDDW